MKVLLLGNSNDTGSFVPDDVKRQHQLRDQIAAEFGEPVEVAVRNAWPNARMVDYVSRAIDEVKPDLVYVNISNYSFTHESLPLKVKRVFGKLGEPVGDAGMRLADSRKWSHNRLFRGLRRAGQLTLGGDTHFTPEEVLARYSELVRVLLRHEGMAVAIKGPMSRSKRGTAREQARKEARRQRVHTPLKQLCEQLHVYYAGSDAPLYLTQPWKRKGMKVGDDMHSNAAGHKRSAEWHYPFLREAWLEHLDVAGEQPGSAAIFDGGEDAMAKQPARSLSPDFPRMGRPARAALEVAGYTELERLNGVSERTILGLHGMGPKAFAELEQALAVRGWTFSQP